MEKELYQPKTLMDAIKHFSSIANCLEYLIPIRWPKGITCPNCGSIEHGFLSTRHLWKCKACKKQFSLKQGTIMEDSPLSYDKWMTAIWLIANAKNGISSYEIHRAIGITQKSAWFLLHRIRLAMNTGSFVKKSGTIEGDETFIGGKAKNMHKDRRENLIKGRGPIGKAIVMGLLERGDKAGGQPSQMMAMVIADRSADTLQGQIRASVEAGSEIMTDEWVGYEGLDADYIHNVINQSIKYSEGNIHTNGAENFWTLFKRCINGTYVSVECDHLPAYLDEEAFRFNERKGKDKDRFVNVLQGITGRRVTYKRLIDNGDEWVPRRDELRKRR
jgi:transposase-like protein